LRQRISARIAESFAKLAEFRKALTGMKLGGMPSSFISHSATCVSINHKFR